MDIKRSLLALLAVCLLPQAVLAAEPDASNPPRTSGPLIALTPISCEDNGPAGPGEARGQGCSWAYQLAPAHAAAAEDFMAYWFQMELDPGRGWCAKELRFSFEVSDARIVSASPTKGERISELQITTTELLVDADGTAPVPGTIAQDVMVGKGRTAVSLDDHSYRYSWRGNSKDKVVIAIGLQIGFDRVPPQLFFTVSGGEGATMGSCRPMVVRVGSH